MRLRDVAMSLAALGACLIGLPDMGGSLAFTILIVATMLCGVALPILRWRWPLSSVGFAFAVLVGWAFAPTLSVAAIVVGGLTAYILRRHVHAPSRGVASAVLLIGDVLALSLISPVMDEVASLERFNYVAWSATWLVVCGLLGELRRRAEESLRKEMKLRLDKQREEFEREAEAQRAYLAREIHDTVTHSLTVIVAQADGALFSSRSENGKDVDIKDDALRTISSIGRESLKQMRGVVGLLRGSEGRSVDPLIAGDDLTDIIESSRAGGLDISFELLGEPPARVPDASLLTLRRVLQEALTNALNHGEGNADVHVSWGEREVRLRVENSCAQENSAKGTGHGVESMKERVKLADGSLRIGSYGKKWVVDAVIPLDAAELEKEAQ